MLVVVVLMGLNCCQESTDMNSGSMIVLTAGGLTQSFFSVRTFAIFNVVYLLIKTIIKDLLIKCLV